MTAENRQANIGTEISKSRRAWSSALRNAAERDFDTAANRLYYSAYHAAMAVCLSEGLEPKTHRGLIHLLKLHFIVPGQLPDWVESALSRLQTERDLADYEADYTLSAERYEERRTEAERLIEQLEAFLRAGGFLGP